MNTKKNFSLLFFFFSFAYEEHVEERVVSIVEVICCCQSQSLLLLSTSNDDLLLLLIEQEKFLKLFSLALCLLHTIIFHFFSCYVNKCKGILIVNEAKTYTGIKWKSGKNG
jgi:hypothetical protein